MSADKSWVDATQASPDAAGPEYPEYSEDEVLLLRLLGQGLTDIAISRQLGSSSRTVGRRLSALQRKMGVISRFEMGAAAQRGGIL